ncbi:nucleotidyltransferase family protein [Agromyces sp. NPDC127015]|uniref:nucleotidyltransferase family protein n=1 Tax=Agromyces sp. NPDC127015 TaxID=3347108 RepID=UPI00364A598B
MASMTAASAARRAAIQARRAAVDAVLVRYHASNPRVFGSVARGDATPASDVDLLVDLEANAGNPLLRIAGIGEELSELFDFRVDVVAEQLLKDGVAATALSEFHIDLLSAVPASITQPLSPPPATPRRARPRASTARTESNPAASPA